MGEVKAQEDVSRVRQLPLPDDDKDHPSLWPQSFELMTCLGKTIDSTDNWHQNVREQRQLASTGAGIELPRSDSYSLSHDPCHSGSRSTRAAGFQFLVCRTERQVSASRDCDCSPVKQRSTSRIPTSQNPAALPTAQSMAVDVNSIIGDFAWNKHRTTPKSQASTYDVAIHLTRTR